MEYGGGPYSLESLTGIRRTKISVLFMEMGEKCKTCTLFLGLRSRLWTPAVQTHICSQIQIPISSRDSIDELNLTSSPGNEEKVC
jgi:hypothetical protein